MEHEVGHDRAVILLQLVLQVHFGAGEQDVAQHGEQVLAHAEDHPAIHESAGRRILQLQLDAALAMDNADIEIRVGLHQRLAVIHVIARRQHGQRTIAKQLMQARVAVVQKLRDLPPREHFQSSFG